MSSLRTISEAFERIIGNRRFYTVSCSAIGLFLIIQFLGLAWPLSEFFNKPATSLDEYQFDFWNFLVNLLLLGAAIWVGVRQGSINKNQLHLTALNFATERRPILSHFHDQNDNNHRLRNQGATPALIHRVLVFCDERYYDLSGSYYYLEVNDAISIPDIKRTYYSLIWLYSDVSTRYFYVGGMNLSREEKIKFFPIGGSYRGSISPISRDSYTRLLEQFEVETQIKAQFRLVKAMQILEDWRGDTLAEGDKNELNTILPTDTSS